MSKPASAKVKFTREYAINASPKILYPYLSTPSGLGRWFAEKASVSPDHIYNFVWDKKDHYAEMSNHRLNRSVRFIFLDEEKNSMPDADYIDFTIESSELTGEQFLRVTDYSAEDDEEEMDELWSNLILSLREIVGG